MARHILCDLFHLPCPVGSLVLRWLYVTSPFSIHSSTDPSFYTSKQRGYADPGGHSFIPLPKSDTPERIISNRDVFDFELSDAQMGELNALDMDEHVCLNHTELP
jgi:hypothetical protein